MATQLVSKPVEPTGDGAVVRWTKWDGYTYASIRTPNGEWFTTQDPTRVGGQRITPQYWEGLLAVIGERNWSTLELLG